MKDKRAGEGYDIIRILFMGREFPMYHGYMKTSFYGTVITIDHDDNAYLRNKIKLHMQEMNRRQ